MYSPLQVLKKKASLARQNASGTLSLYVLSSNAAELDFCLLFFRNRLNWVSVVNCGRINWLAHPPLLFFVCWNSCGNREINIRFLFTEKSQLRRNPEKCSTSIRQLRHQKWRNIYMRVRGKKRFNSGMQIWKRKKVDLTDLYQDGEQFSSLCCTYLSAISCNYRIFF